MNEIGILVFWGPWEGEFEPEPIVSVGQVAGEIVPSAPELVKENQSWMIRIDETNAMYASYSKERCANSDGNLQLLICAIIPKGQRLVAKKSPLDLLEDIRRRFESHFTFNLQAKKPHDKKVRDVFTQLLKNYALEECPWYVFYMEGDKPASLCVESRAQLDALMRYNAYPALAHIEHLEIGFNCKTTVDVNTKGESNNNAKKRKWQWWWKREKPLKTTEPIQPKPQPQETPAPTTRQEAQVAKESMPIQHKGYQVLVNGEAQNVFLRWDDDEYSLRRESTEDYRYESLRFKLGELKSAPKRRVATLSGRTVAQLDEKKGCINCEMKPAERWLYKEIVFSPDSDVEARKFVKYNPDKLQILIDREPWNGDKIKPSVAKKAVEKNNIRIAPKEVEGYSFSLASAKIAKDRLVVTIEAKKTSRPIGGVIDPQFDKKQSVPTKKSLPPSEMAKEKKQQPKNNSKDTTSLIDIDKDLIVGDRQYILNVLRWLWSDVRYLIGVRDFFSDLWDLIKSVFELIWDLLVYLWDLIREHLIVSVSVLSVGIACVVFYTVRISDKNGAEQAAFENCTTIEQCEDYIQTYPDGKYRQQVDALLAYFCHYQDSIREIQIQDSIRIANEKELMGFEACLDKDVVMAYNACLKYCEVYSQGTYRNKVDSLMATKHNEYEKKETAAYLSCKRAHNYEDISKACKGYEDLFPYGQHSPEVDSIQTEIESVRSKTLIQLNDGEKVKKLNARYFSKSERLALEIIMGRNLMDRFETYLLEDYIQRHGFNGDGGRFKFKTWDDVNAAGTYARDEWYRSTKEWNDNRNEIMRMVNNRNIRILDDKYRSYLTNDEIKAVEWLLSLKQGDEAKYDCLKHYTKGKKFDFDGWYQIEGVYKEANTIR